MSVNAKQVLNRRDAVNATLPSQKQSHATNDEPWKDINPIIIVKTKNGYRPYAIQSAKQCCLDDDATARVKIIEKKRQVFEI